MCVFLCLVAKISDRFLEQRFDIKFCVKLEKYASEPCAMFSDAYGEKRLKNSSVF